MAIQHQSRLENNFQIEDKVTGIGSADKDGLSVNELEEQTDIEQLQFSEERKKRILRKVDLRVVPLLSFLYLVSFIDRGNLGNAKVAGMAEDLHLTGTQYNIAVTLFFIPYSLLEVPSNIVLKITRPSVWISVLMFLWGIVITLTGIVHSYSGLLAVRIFLGVAEAGFFPAATYLLTIWYVRYEVQSRMVFFYAAVSLAGAFSGILAFAIQKMDGVGGLSGWRWIFILEGIVTVFISLFIWFFLPDSPGTAQFLTPDEREFLITRLEHDTGSGRGRVTNGDKINRRQIWAGLTEWKVWMAVFMYWATSISSYGFTYTVPTVIVELGYTAANAQLMTVPIYVVAMIFTIANAILSDRYKQRTPFILLGVTVGIVGFACLLAIPHPQLPGLTYGMLFLATCGIYMSLVPTLCFIGNNVAPSSKRAVAMAHLICMGNLGGIAGSNIFLAREAPHYWTGYGFILGIDCAAFITCLFLRYKFKSINAARDKLTEQEIRATYTERELLELGDMNPYFRYTL
ncbi:major facilitator superfamily domain-containing protein [Xylogone sp. PMI_703]|nr:major facilitator superfamily domain-containing protein [Xylogone sp. PMI_703]